MQHAIKEYIDARKADGLTSETLDHMKRRLEFFIEFLSRRGFQRFPDVAPRHLDEYAASLARRNASYKTRCAYMSTIRVFFRWLHDRGRILTDPARDTQVPNEDEVPLPEPPLSEEEVMVILDGMPRRNATDLRNRLHLELLYSCGLRVTETTTLKLSDFDMANRSVRIRGKGGRVRVLPLMKGTLNSLKDYLALRRSLLKGPDDGTLLIGKTTGKPIEAQSVRPVLRKVARRLRLKRRLHPHLLRHSIAVHMLQRGADIRHVQEFLGHASIDTTKIYLRMVPGRLKEDYDRAMPSIAVKPA